MRKMIAWSFLIAVTGLLLWGITVSGIVVVRAGLRVVDSGSREVVPPYTELYPMGIPQNVLVSTATIYGEIGSTVHDVIGLVLSERNERLRFVWRAIQALDRCNRIWSEHSHIVNRMGVHIVKWDGRVYRSYFGVGQSQEEPEARHLLLDFSLRLRHVGLWSYCRAPLEH
jgi:hypothetical protein